MGVYGIMLQLLLLLAGLGVFLAGIGMAEGGLSNAPKQRLRNVFIKISKNKFAGVAAGAGVTAVLHSSSASTVMVVGLVNTGLLTLTQAAPIIMGANIGTTITAQMLQFQGLGLTHWFAAGGAAGMFMRMAKAPKIQLAGSVLAGVGLVFSGLYLMAHSMEFLAAAPAVAHFFASKTNPFVLLALGLALTAAIQSSTAAMGLLVTLVLTPSAAGGNLLGFHQAAFAVLGMNIGTCITALLGAAGASQNAKRAAVIHVLFNTLGALLFLPVLLFTPLTAALSALPPATAIAVFHTVFNLSTTAVLIWFVNPLVRLSEVIV